MTPPVTPQLTCHFGTEEKPLETPAKPNQPRLLLTVEEAAQSLGIGRTTMYGLIKAGHISSVRIGQLRRVPANAVTAYVDQLTSQQYAA